MPRASLNPKDAVASKQFGVQEGNVEIIDAKVKVHQYPPNKDTGKQQAPFLCVQEVYRLLDKDWNPIPDADDITVEYGLGESGFAKFSPGLGQSEDDDNPEDQGKEVDAEGNTLYTDDPASTLNDKCKWVKHSNSLIACGFRPDKIGWMPNLIGLKGHVKTETEKFTGRDGKEGSSTYNVFDKIVHFPYETPAKGKGKAGKPAPAPAKGKAAPAPPPAAPAGDLDADTAAVLSAVLDDPKSKIVAGDLPLDKFYMAVQRAMMLAKKTRDEMMAVMSMVKDNDQLQAYGEDTGRLMVNPDEGTVTIA